MFVLHYANHIFLKCRFRESRLSSGSYKYSLVHWPSLFTYDRYYFQLGMDCYFLKYHCAIKVVDEAILSYFLSIVEVDRSDDFPVISAGLDLQLPMIEW